MAAVGRDGEGSYRTTALKEYPSELCRFLAAIFLEDCPSDVVDEVPGIEVPEAVADLYVPLDPYVEFVQQHDCALGGARMPESG